MVYLIYNLSNKKKKQRNISCTAILYAILAGCIDCAVFAKYQMTLEMSNAIKQKNALLINKYKS